MIEDRPVVFIVSVRTRHWPVMVRARLWRSLQYRPHCEQQSIAGRNGYYYWMTPGRAPGGSKDPHQAALKLLLYSATEHAHANGLTFDLDDGSSLEPSNRALDLL